MANEISGHKSTLPIHPKSTMIVVNLIVNGAFPLYLFQQSQVEYISISSKQICSFQIPAYASRKYHWKYIFSCRIVVQNHRLCVMLLHRVSLAMHNQNRPRCVNRLEHGYFAIHKFWAANILGLHLHNTTHTGESFYGRYNSTHLKPHKCKRTLLSSLINVVF